MAKKIVEFLRELAKKAGVDVESEQMKPLFSAENLQTIEVPDEIVTGIDNGLISLSAAKNNHPEIKNHYFAAAFNGVDSEIDRLMEEEKLPDDVKAEIKAERSSTKRIVKIANKIKELEAQKAHAGKGATEELNKQINQLNTEIRTIKENEAKIRAEYEKKLKDKDMSYALRGLRAKYKTIWDELDPEIRDQALDAVLNKNLNKNDAEFVVDGNGNIQLLKKNGGGNVFSEDNRQMTPEMFLDKTFAEAKILKVTDANQNQNTGGGRNNQSGHDQNRYSSGFNQNGNNTSQNGNNQNNNSGNSNSTLSSLVKESLKNLESSVDPISGKPSI